MLHSVNIKLSTKSTVNFKSEPQAISKILLVIILSGILIAVFDLIIYDFLFSEKDYVGEPWIIILSCIQFMPTRIASYVICFCLGIYAFYKNWFKNKSVPGLLSLWTTLTIGFWYFFREAAINLSAGYSFHNAIIYILLRISLFFSLLLTLVSFGIKYWDSSSKLNRMLAKNSYTIYLIHLIFVIICQLVLFKYFEGLIYLKLFVVCTVSINLSLFFSQFFSKYLQDKLKQI